MKRQRAKHHSDPAESHNYATENPVFIKRWGGGSGAYCHLQKKTLQINISAATEIASFSAETELVPILQQAVQMVSCTHSSLASGTAF